MSKQAKQLYEFGPFRIDATERTLLCRERPVPLTPKVFDTLLVLVENSGHVLGKDELMERIWPDSFVEENNLAQNISVLRKVLGEAAEGLKYIETVPKRGYRFVADVRKLADDPLDVIVREHTTARVVIEEEDERDGAKRVGQGAGEKALVRDAEYRVLDAEPVPSVSRPALPEPRAKTEGLIERARRSKATIAVALTLVAVALATVAYFALFRHSRRSSAQPRALAILPFRNLKQDAETDFLGFSLADAIITKLGYVSALTVRPSSYVDKYRNQVIDPRKVADELNVNTLLTGNFIKEGDDLRITAQLVDVNSKEILWHEAMDLKYEKLLTVQDRVAQQIIKGLEVKLSPDEAKRLKLDVPQNPLAYEYYLRGVDRYSTNEFPLAIEMLEKSVAIDPNFALAWAHLGTAYAANASFHFGGREMYNKAQSAYEKALLINPEQIRSAHLHGQHLHRHQPRRAGRPSTQRGVEDQPELCARSLGAGLRLSLRGYA
jgi:DNA-binding winged helix-turn-helix (wHTH) protein/TolB-like protein